VTKQFKQIDLAEQLRSAQPRLICRVDAQGSLGVKLTPYIRTVEPSWQEVIEEGRMQDQRLHRRQPQPNTTRSRQY
jgi:hypothetical protein